VLGHADDAVGAVHVIADEGDVIPLHLGLRHVRVLQEEQVVDGHDLLRALRGEEQRVRGMGEIERCAHQAIERRPFEPMPRVVEAAHGEAAVHELRVLWPRALRITVAERRREEKEAVLRSQQRQPLRQGQDV
jgi:hypothetical protein